MGSAQIFTTLLGMVRVKLIAVMLGAEGIGILGNYQSITGIASTLSAMGTGTSAVLEVAQSQKNEESERKARLSLLCFAWLTGIVGCLIFYFLTPQLSTLTFGTIKHSQQLAILAITIIFSNIAVYQSALIQGRRQIADLAIVTIFAAVISTFASLLFVSLYGVQGIVPSMVVTSATTCLMLMRYTGRLAFPETRLTLKELGKRLGKLWYLGTSIVWSGFLTALAAFATRAMITRGLGLDAVGIYTAALSLSTVFVQFILSAMGNDFYPRLTTHASDHPTMCQLINEQTEVGLLLAFPCLIMTFVFSPQIVAFFYAEDFALAVDVLRWLILGNIGRVIAWPMGFSTLAKSQTVLFVSLETAFHCLTVVLGYLGLVYGGLNGVAISSVVLYVLHIITLAIICRLTIGFAWSRSVVAQLLWMLPTTILVYAVAAFGSSEFSLIFGVLATLVTSLLCISIIIRRANLIPNKVVLRLRTMGRLLGQRHADRAETTNHPSRTDD